MTVPVFNPGVVYLFLIKLVEPVKLSVPLQIYFVSLDGALKKDAFQATSYSLILGTAMATTEQDPLGESWLGVVVALCAEVLLIITNEKMQPKSKMLNALKY